MSKTYFLVMIFLALFVFSNPLAWAPPISCDVFSLENPACVQASSPAVPEPSSMALIGMGIAGAALLKRRKK